MTAPESVYYPETEVHGFSGNHDIIDAEEDSSLVLGSDLLRWLLLSTDISACSNL